jgi:hypothetical protein
MTMRGARRHAAQAASHVGQARDHRRQLARLLRAARTQIPDDAAWRQWLKENTSLTPQQADGYIRRGK